MKLIDTSVMDLETFDMDESEMDNIKEEFKDAAQEEGNLQKAKKGPRSVLISAKQKLKGAALRIRTVSGIRKLGPQK